MAQQPLLAVETTTVTRQCSIATDDPVTGNDHGDRVRAVGGPDGTHGCGGTDRLGELPV